VDFTRPYGIYDPVLNRGFVSVGISHDISAFAAHSIATWWKCEGSAHLSECLPAARPGRFRRQQQLQPLGLENPDPNPVIERLLSGRDRGPLSQRGFQMESH
jgi:hypothetical protein